MFPTKIDLQGAISPFTWGFELKTWHVIVYTISTLILALLSGRRWCIQINILVLLLVLFLHIGVTKMPWPAMILICVFTA
jgi:glycine betaine/proline transport system permease protein